MVALVNVLTPGFDRGHPVPSLSNDERRRRARSALSPPFTSVEAESLGRLAARLRQVFTAADQGDVDRAAGIVNRLLDDYRPAPYLARHGGRTWHLHFHNTAPDTEPHWGAGFAAVLGSEAWRRLGVCSAPRCDRVFVDRSRNGSRRFCSTACQNRTKAAAFRARRAPAVPLRAPRAPR
jgi:CGNR zinc finger/Putative stress-induced transcription regulator